MARRALARGRRAARDRARRRGPSGIDGYEVARRLRAVAPQRITLVAITGVARPAIASARSRPASTSTSVKPVDFAVLAQLLGAEPPRSAPNRPCARAADRGSRSARSSPRSRAARRGPRACATRAVARSQRSRAVFAARERGQRDRRQRARLAALERPHALDQRVAVLIRQTDVADQQMGPLGLDRRAARPRRKAPR